MAPSCRDADADDDGEDVDAAPSLSPPPAVVPVFTIHAFVDRQTDGRREGLTGVQQQMAGGEVKGYLRSVRIGLGARGQGGVRRERLRLQLDGNTQPRLGHCWRRTADYLVRRKN